MRFAHAAAIALALASGTALAHDDRSKDPFSAIDPQLLLQGAIQESDVSLLLDYVRAAMLAAAEGREPPPPPAALERRAEELGGELRARGTLAGLLLLSALEAQSKALLRDGLPPPRRQMLPPKVPYTPVSND
jgi:hypothetical protein